MVIRSNYHAQAKRMRARSLRRHSVASTGKNRQKITNVAIFWASHLLVRDDGDGGVMGAHVVEHVVLGLSLHLLPSEHAVVERHRHRLAHQLQAVQSG